MVDIENLASASRLTDAIVESVWSRGYSALSSTDIAGALRIMAEPFTLDVANIRLNPWILAMFIPTLTFLD